MKKRGGGFNLDIEVGDAPRTVRVTGSISAGCPTTGPTYDCGGTPEEPPEIEDFRAFMIHKRKDGKKVQRELSDPDGKLFDLCEDRIWEQVNDARGDDYE